MRKLFFFTLMSCLIAIGNNKLFAQYSNTTLNGPWFWHSVPYNPDSLLMYFVFDGNGNITDVSIFKFGSSNYSVSLSGAISGNVFFETSSHPITGQLTSQNSGTLTLNIDSVQSVSGQLSRIPNSGALTDSLVGILHTDSCGQTNVTIVLNSQGQVISSLGLITPVSGRVYADSGVFIGHLKTGDTLGNWYEFSVLGYYGNDSLIGSLELDASPGQCDGGTTRLLRKGTATPTGIASNNYRQFTIFPNPFSLATTLRTDNLLHNATLTVDNCFGQTVKQFVIRNSDSFVIRRDNLPSGLYFVRLTEDSKVIATKKLLITD